jgi:hypothetical protein
MASIISGQPFGQRHAAPLDADQPEVRRTVVLLHNLVRQPYQRALNLRRRHQPALLAQPRLRRSLCSGRFWGLAHNLLRSVRSAVADDNSTGSASTQISRHQRAPALREGWI